MLFREHDFVSDPNEEALLELQELELNMENGNDDASSGTPCTIYIKEMSFDPQQSTYL